MRIGFNPVYAKCYCKGCYHIFTIMYNSCGTYLGGDSTCPFCGVDEKVVREDSLEIDGSLDRLAEDYLKDKPRKLKKLHEDMKERERISRLFKTNPKDGWYPPEDYP